MTENTSNIFLDITGLDFKGCKTALHIIATLLAERGGELETVAVEYPDKTIITPDFTPITKKLNIGYTNRILSSSFSADELIKILNKMGYNSEVSADSKGQELDVYIPSYRSDILHPVDLVEDVAIGFGYENFTPILPQAMTYGKIRAMEAYCDKLRTLLIGQEFTEIMTLSLSNPQEQFISLGQSPEAIEHITISNPRTEDFSILRVSLLPSLLTTLRNNKHRDLPQRIFEIADVVLGANAINRRCIAGVVIHAKTNLTEMKSTVDYILQNIAGDKKIVLRSKVHPAFIPGRCVGILLLEAREECECGYFGELHPKTITDFDLGYPVTAFELDAESFL